MLYICIEDISTLVDESSRTEGESLDCSSLRQPRFFIWDCSCWCKIINWNPRNLTNLSKSYKSLLKQLIFVRFVKICRISVRRTLYICYGSLREKSYKSVQILQIFFMATLFVRFVKICRISVRRTLLCLNAFSFPQRTRHATSLRRKILRNECNYISKMLYICVILEMNYSSSFFTQLSHQ